ncbi:MAG TPA: hypothetical protein ENN86_02295 [Desulfobacteraceae bacterium]|nr:hypothetical protein [Desulfobacteraceae bacterium]
MPDNNNTKFDLNPKCSLVHLLLPAALIASVAGVAAFIILIIPDFNIYWLIVSPIIIAFYQAPAVYIYWLWKKKTGRLLKTNSSCEDKKVN